MTPRQIADKRVIHSHPFCALCGNHMDLTVERSAGPVTHTVVSTVTSTAHEVRAGRAGPRVVCRRCHERHLI